MHRVHAVSVGSPQRYPTATKRLEIAARTHLLVSLISEGSIVRERHRSSRSRIGSTRRHRSRLREEASAIRQPRMLKTPPQELAAVRPRRQQRVRPARTRVVHRDARRWGDRRKRRDPSRSRQLRGIARSPRKPRWTWNAAIDARCRLDRSRLLLLGVVIASLLAVIGIGIFYVRARLIRRLTDIGGAMRKLSSGDIDLTFPPPAIG